MEAVTMDALVVGETYYLELPRFRGDCWEPDTYKLKSSVLSIETTASGAWEVVFGKNSTINRKSEMIGIRAENKHRSILNRGLQFVYNPLNQQLYSVEVKRITDRYVADTHPIIAEKFLQQYTTVYKPMKEVLIRRRENRLINKVLQHITRDQYFIWA